MKLRIEGRQMKLKIKANDFPARARTESSPEELAGLDELAEKFRALGWTVSPDSWDSFKLFAPGHECIFKSCYEKSKLELVERAEQAPKVLYTRTHGLHEQLYSKREALSTKTEFI